ncbi:cytochrome c maturation protein CcmE [Alphaproteobacteria bacterium]|nr:cytochrome c maturation protein CcmE [Alphaproteobacteria bacterium]
MKFQIINPRVKNRLIFFIIIFICFSSSIYLASYALKDKISFFYSPSELNDLEIKEDQLIRVGGLLQINTLKLKNTIWYFDIIDDQKVSISVVFKKTLPNLVEENKGIIVEGKLKNKVLIASMVLAKHDENYMPQSAVDKMKSKGVWRGN